MADIAKATGAVIRPVSGVANGHEQYRHEAAEAIAAGQVYRLDTNGKAVKADSSVARVNLFMALNDVVAGQGVVGLKRGLVDGFNLDARAFNDQVFLSNTAGNIADAAGTASNIVGRVTSIAFSGTPGASDKTLLVTLPS